MHLVAEDVHHPGDAGHADAADTHEMDGADVGADTPHAIAPPVGTGRRATSSAPTNAGVRPMRSTRSARSRAASGRPQSLARSAALGSEERRGGKECGRRWSSGGWP